MSEVASHDNVLHVELAADIGARAEDVYRLIADYTAWHPRILPTRYFRGLAVEKGGYGDGTTFRYSMVAFGRTQHARARVTEPEPGRVLVESDLDKHVVTTFTIDSIGALTCRATIATDMSTRGGWLGRIERVIAGSFLRRVFAAELAQLSVVAAGVVSAGRKRGRRVEMAQMIRRTEDARRL